MRGSILGATLALVVVGGMMGISSVATGQSVGEVGDLDSFGRSVKYLGMMQSEQVVLQADCSQVQLPTRCITVSNPATSVSFNEANVGTMRLPGWSTRSLVCFSLSPRTSYSLRNTATGDIYGSFSGEAVIEVENSVLNDPALMDPFTNTPLNGKMIITLGTGGETTLLRPGDVKSGSETSSRDCISGLVSRRMLMGTYGLSSLQATQFFQRPTTLRFASTGRGFGVERASFFYGIRLFGD